MADTIFAGRYRLIDVLGEGSNGPVWRAVDANRGDLEVALKRFVPGQPNIVAYEEAGILTRLESDHILRVHNADTFEDVPYIATAVAASTTEAELARQLPLGLRPDLVLTWTRQLLVGLRICHDSGLVHRDVKPANVFIDRGGRALLGDFGLARADHGQGAPIAGTERIRSPELFGTGYATRMSDIWAVGVTMYRLLTGEWPFETSQQVLRGDFVRVGDAAPHVPRRLAERIERCLRIDPSARFSSAAEMHSELGVADLLPRVWSPLPPHAGHERCWVEMAEGWTGLDVCLIAPGAVAAIEVRRATASRPRVNAFCRTGIRAARVAKELRKTFRDLTTD
jgi:eukaryotic-like serine/threonine-protein kinase